MDQKLLGQILASVVLAAADAGAVLASGETLLTNPQAISQIISGFLQVWVPAAKTNK